ncbi:uncharacterized protein [Anabrus simplex]|uniref:uncharacterized protein n=1 Tax=Anabrus simplex TaxID=316456 RepID=UPI0035A3AEF2
MEKVVFVKCEPAWPLDTEEEPSNFDSNELLSEKMHLKEEVKSELAEPGQVQMNTFEDNYKLVSEKTFLREETESELVEPRKAQLNTFQPFADVKNEILMEEHTDDQLEPCFKEDNKIYCQRFRQPITMDSQPRGRMVPPVTALVPMGQH